MEGENKKLLFQESYFDWSCWAIKGQDRADGSESEVIQSALC